MRLGEKILREVGEKSFEIAKSLCKYTKVGEVSFDVGVGAGVHGNLRVTYNCEVVLREDKWY